MVRLTSDDSCSQIAHKIFYFFEVNQNCAVAGMALVDAEPRPRGLVVCDMLRELDSLENTENGRRKRRIPENSIGGFVAQKIFKYKEETVGGIMRYTIWRIQ